MDESNLQPQADEVEALAAIYGSQWTEEDTDSHIYSIEITAEDPEEISQHLILTLQIQLPEDYPTKAPPVYELRAPWLRGDERRELCNKLEAIYLENIGESVIYLWAEAIREFMLETLKNQDKQELGSVEEQLQESWTDPDPETSGGDSPETEGTNSLMAEGGQIEGECPEIFHGDFVHDRKSIFQAHLAEVHHEKEVKLVMQKLLENKKIAAATHNIQAYRIMQDKGGTKVYVAGCEDDGETHAGTRMRHLLEIIDAMDVLVVVTRWYGGVHLGADRFKHINNCTRNILEERGYIRDKGGKKKGPKSAKKKK